MKPNGKSPGKVQIADPNHVRAVPIVKIIPILLFFSLLSGLAIAAPLSIDLTVAVAPAKASPYGPGTTTNPQGHEITADSRSFLLDGKPWVPVAGEFHYSRYPRAEWRDELLKMKAGGISVVSTYVFWIHQEETQGQFDWTGQRSLRDFLQLCQEVGLKAFVRMGPWCHGEVRNGGFPDWVQNSGTKLRSADPAFLALVKPLFEEEARQMQGLLWKDGGPVIGVQLDNECRNAGYLLALKKLARSAGVDVPFYAITGWQGGLPDKELIPLFGGYTDGFWGGSLEDYRKEFIFTNARAGNTLGAQLVGRNTADNQLISQFPYACVEIGAGMMSSYTKRIKINSDAVAAMALAKLGCGNNLPGYYMYQGGMNPDGKLSTLQEDHPNPMPVKDYDFQTALGACGQVREQFHLLLEQHLFLQDFGAALARMPAYFPDRMPANLDDFDTLRWDMRSDGASGFLFYSNEQPHVALPEHKDVQFQVKTNAGTLLIPRRPVTIPAGSYGIWPVNLDCNGVTLEYATAQPLCRIDAGHGVAVYFFAALDGIDPELLLRANGNRVTWVAGEREESDGSLRVYKLKTGTTAAVTVAKPTGGGVAFVVLTPEQGRRLWRASFDGRDHVILSDSTVIGDGNGIRLQSDNVNALAMSIFPPVANVNFGAGKPSGIVDGMFTRFTSGNLGQPAPVKVTVTQEQAAGSSATDLKGVDEGTWSDAAVYKLNIPITAENRHLILNIHYIGDAARLYVGNKLYDDNFFNGDPFALGLWRIPASQWPGIRLKVLPYSDGLAGRLPEEARKQVDAAKAASAMDQITLTAADQFDLRVSPR
jgi:hypothetical protein